MTQDFKSVSPAQAREWQENGKAIIVDVREKAEFDEEHIVGAVHHPVSAFDAAKLSSEAGDKVLIFQCASGKRAGDACVQYADFSDDSAEIYILEGSLPGWKQAGLPTVKGAAGTKFSLERQVLMVAGGLVLFFIAIDEEIISAIVGAGMIFAGYTGNCMMKQLLMKLSYNQST